MALGDIQGDCYCDPTFKTFGCMEDECVNFAIFVMIVFLITFIASFGVLLFLIFGTQERQSLSKAEMSLISLASLLRFIRYAIQSAKVSPDPDGIVMNMLYGLPLVFLVGGFMLLIFVWAKAYGASGISNSLVTRKGKRVYMAFVSAFCASQLFVYLWSIGDPVAAFPWISYTIGLALLICVFGFTIYGGMLYKRMMKVPNMRPVARRGCKRISLLGFGVSGGFIVAIVLLLLNVAFTKQPWHPFPTWLIARMTVFRLVELWSSWLLIIELGSVVIYRKVQESKTSGSKTSDATRSRPSNSGSVNASVWAGDLARETSTDDETSV